MRRSPYPLLLALSLVVPSLLANPAMAGERFFRRKTRVVETVAPLPRPQDRVIQTGMLGTFMPTPYITVRGNGAVGGGYSPLGSFGRENSLDVYGPLSAFREVSAPVNTVVRGYDGLPTQVQGTTFSNPMQPGLGPVVYPTRANNYSALPFQETNPRRDKALMWIDQN